MREVQYKESADEYRDLCRGTIGRDGQWVSCERFDFNTGKWNDDDVAWDVMTGHIPAKRISAKEAQDIIKADGPAQKQTVKGGKPKTGAKKWQIGCGGCLGVFLLVIIIAIVSGSCGSDSTKSSSSTSDSESAVETATEAATDASTEDEWPSITALGLDDDTMITIYNEIEEAYANSPSYSNEGEMTEEDVAAEDTYADQVLQEIGEKYGITADDANNVYGYVLMNYDELIANKGTDIADLKLKTSDLLEVNSFGGNIIIKAKVSQNLLNNKMIRDSCYFEVYEAIQDYNLQNYNTLSYWAVADMTDGSEMKVISFDVTQDVMQKVADGTILENKMVDYVSDLWIAPVLQDK